MGYSEVCAGITTVNKKVKSYMLITTQPLTLLHFVIAQEMSSNALHKGLTVMNLSARDDT